MADAPLTRMIAMGAAPLMEGFQLIGFETYPDADAATVERVLESLHREQTRALLLLEHDLARSQGPQLTRARNEGGRIVVTELPRLSQPQAYHPLVEDVVTSILGPSALGETR